MCYLFRGYKQVKCPIFRRSALKKCTNADDDPHNIRDNQGKSNQFPAFSLSQRLRTLAFPGIGSRCNFIGLVPIWDCPGVNS